MVSRGAQDRRLARATFLGRGANLLRSSTGSPSIDAPVKPVEGHKSNRSRRTIGSVIKTFGNG